MALEQTNNRSRKESIELLAFVLMVKNVQPNSIFYKDAGYKMAKRIGMSDSRIFNKYLTKCIAVGLCSAQVQRFNTNGHRTIYKFIAYRDALSLLLGIKKRQLKYFPIHRGAIKFKAFQYAIEHDLVALNFAQQEYLSNENFPNKNNIIKEIKSLNAIPVSERKTCNRKRMNKLVKKLRAADAQRDHSALKGHNNGIVTGCQHFAKQIGKCSTTAHKRINKWIEEKSLQVQDIFTVHPVRSELEAHYLIDAFRQQKAKGIHLYCPKTKEVRTILGKWVSMFNSTTYSYSL